MTSWEYCTLIGLSLEDPLNTNYPHIRFYTSEGIYSENLADKDNIYIYNKELRKRCNGDGLSESQRVSKRIAQLGKDGWEMVEYVVEKGLIVFKHQIPIKD